MASITENTYVGDGSTTLYSFTFPYIDATDVLVSVDGTNLERTTEYIFANATTLQLTVAPTDGAAVRVYRQTTSDDLKAVFFPGSAIRARDLNDNFTQNLYVTQEADRDATSATGAAEAAAESAAQAAEDAAIAQSAADQAATAESKADSALAGVSVAQSAATNAQDSADSANTAATQAAADAAEATAAVEQILDAVEDGAVVSVNGYGGIVNLAINDLIDVQVDSSADGSHYPQNGDALVWDTAMGHWMPGTIDIPEVPVNNLDISALPTLP